MRMLRYTILLGCLAASSAPAELPRPSKASVDYYLGAGQDFRPSRPAAIDAWENDLVAALKRGPADNVAATLAPRYALSSADMKELIDLWLFAHADLDSPRPTPASRRELHDRFLALVERTHRSDLVLEAAAATLLSSDRDCGDQLARELLAGATDGAADAWPIAAASGDCGAAYLSFSRTAPDRAMPALIRVAASDWLPAVESVPLYAYLLSPDGMHRIDPPHREAVRRYLTQAYLVTLFKAGLSARARDVFDGLPTTEQDAIFAGNVGKPSFLADGLPMTLDDYDVSRDSLNRQLQVDLVETYAAAGRSDVAERFFARIAGASSIREKLECGFALDAKGRDCGIGFGSDASDLAMLDYMLHDGKSDPYRIAELFYADGPGAASMSDGPAPSAGAIDTLACHVFTEPAYASFCEASRRAARSAAYSTGDPDRQETARKIVAAANVPGYAAARQEALDRAARTLGPPVTEARGGFADRPSVEPLPPPFLAQPIPAAQRGTAPATPWSKNWASLPRGYDPVRIGRDGGRIAVISLSQNYDPTGEVTRGGYWVHLSEDGGKSWRAPLYTGLADRFPYVVVTNPRLPMFDGDALTIAVDEKLLDTRTITYPPVALRTLRSREGLYLRIPIEALTRDSDGDGLTDLAAAHLLLAPTGNVPAAYVVGGPSDAPCTAESASLRAAMMSILDRIFSGGTGAIFEPVDRNSTKISLPVQPRIDPNSADRPILIEGNPADYACLHPDRLMIVYGPEQLAQLRRVTPDFHAVSLGPLIFDRAHDRGYLAWSTGWSGGTLRLHRVGNEWKIDTIGSWIT